MLHTSLVVTAKKMLMLVYSYGEEMDIRFCLEPYRGGSSHGLSGRPSPHWSKVGTVHGCEKQSALDTWASYHLNPSLLSPLLYDKRLQGLPANLYASLIGFHPRLKGLQRMSSLATDLGLCRIFFRGLNAHLTPDRGNPAAPRQTSVITPRSPWYAPFGFRKSWILPR